MSTIIAWWRRRYWDFEDTVTDWLDWQPHPAPQVKPLPPPAKQSPQPYTDFHTVGVGGRQLTVEQENDERLRLIFEQLSRGHLTEIRF